MASRELLIATFVIFSYGVLCILYLMDDNNLKNYVQPYKEYPEFLKKENRSQQIFHTQDNGLHLQNEYYGAGCQVNPYRESLKILLHKWNSIAERRNISEYFICFGSMLGSVRNGEIIPLDTDVDVCMLRNDYHKLYPEESRRPLDLNDGNFHMLLQRHSPHPQLDTPRRDCDGKIQRTTTDDCSILDPHARLYIHAKIYLDIFMIEDHGEILWDEYRNVFHKRDIIFPLNSCSYLGITTKCPRNPSNYLTAYYGENFKSPLTICKNGRWVSNVHPKRAIKFVVFFIIIGSASLYHKLYKHIYRAFLL